MISDSCNSDAKCFAFSYSPVYLPSISWTYPPSFYSISQNSLVGNNIYNNPSLEDVHTKWWKNSSHFNDSITPDSPRLFPNYRDKFSPTMSEILPSSY